MNKKTRPDYYKIGKYEPKDVISDWELNFNLGCVVKYIARAGNKPGNSALSDLEKAKQYLEFEIEKLSGSKEFIEAKKEITYMFI